MIQFAPVSFYLAFIFVFTYSSYLPAPKKLNAKLRKIAYILLPLILFLAFLSIALHPFLPSLYLGADFYSHWWSYVNIFIYGIMLYLGLLFISYKGYFGALKQRK